jgi:4-hydroxy-2-oxoheptanedioate aldolase
MGMSFGYRETPSNPVPPEMVEARARVFAACKAAGVAFLDGMPLAEVSQRIDEGVRISGGGAEGEVAAAGRAYARRTMPV